MIKDVIIKKLNKYNDERGWLTEIWREDESGYEPVMSYISQTKPGVVRGPHEHKYQSDCFVFIGPGSFELYLWDKREDSQSKGEHIKIKVGEDDPTMVIVPPGVVHGYKCVSDIPGWCINLPNKLYKGKDKQEEIDEIRWEIDKNSPYKIN
ncbi:dTDP-4-dehydrorhamnose 3,5-epimerase family protein [Candidatus Parcubacteria bacterium]|nr:dTDP-4-dehydrorhamnose 3,5-epimerase family protein [Candidatus Parcubacteria bacterium]